MKGGSGAFNPEEKLFVMERAIRALVPDPFVAALASVVALHNGEYPMQEIE